MVHYIYKRQSDPDTAWRLETGPLPDTRTGIAAGSYIARAVSEVAHEFVVTAASTGNPGPSALLASATATYFFGGDNAAMTAQGGGQALTPVAAAPSHAAGYVTPAVGRNGLRSPVDDADVLSVACVFRAPERALLVGTQGDGDSYGWSLATFNGRRYFQIRAALLPEYQQEPTNPAATFLAEVLVLDRPGGAARRVAGNAAGTDEVSELTGPSWAAPGQVNKVSLGVANGGGGAFDAAAADFAALAIWSGTALTVAQATAVIGELRSACASRGITVR
ncbi:hypothetical protein [Acuticoccus sp.]|uniref:hypothetical protein n=1 Tax=Acuticoccus sp. TaxID=1904378 RepID=UPI003B52375C